MLYGNNKVTLKTPTYAEVSQLAPSSVKVLISTSTNLSSFYERQLLMTHFGFCSRKGRNDSIYGIKQLQESAYLSNRKLCTCFVNLTEAYDHINKDYLLSSKQPSVSAQYIDLIQELYLTKSYNIW